MTASTNDVEVVHRIGGSVDEVGAEARAAMLASRSLKAEAKLWGLDLAVRCCDLTTLEGADSPASVRQLASKAMRPAPLDHSIPHVAALCIYPRLVPAAVEALKGSAVAVASVATAFPSGQSALELRVAEIERAHAEGASEIDSVISRGALLAGDDTGVYEEVVAAKKACGDAHLKVILETGELGSYDRVRRASLIAMAAGADFIKTSTGKIAPAATLPVALVMAEAIRDFADFSGRRVGLKVAGGIRSAKDALRYLVLVHETLGTEWLTPERFRIGASSLLNDLLMQMDKQRSKTYSDSDRYTVA
ncbi:deoxyribose-phosphate aldolase [soil metagenome]|nr:deoxyribose-phosphate aldolase [Actinomycetota bacterium]MDQ3218604.1 deoxyribose-phosphate aldolase [Actinomycetota bacterium]